MPPSSRRAPPPARLGSARSSGAAHAGTPAIYVNDNRERWRSEFRELARLAAEASASGAAIARSLAPGDDDYAVLKPKHSVFFATALDLLLRHLRATRLLITGVASDPWDRHERSRGAMRDDEVIVPDDCVAALAAARNARALRHLGEVHCIATPASPRLCLSRRRARRRSGWCPGKLEL